MKKNINYVVAVKVYENIKYTIGNLTKWIKITKGLDVVSLRFNADSGKEQRYIIVRKQTSEYPKSMSQLIVIVHMGQILNYQLIKYRISTILELIVRIESKS